MCWPSALCGPWGASRHQAAIALLVPLAQELAHRAGSHGITVADLRIVGAQRGLLPNAGEGRQLSYLGAVMKAAGLRATKDLRRSVVPETHGNIGRVWTCS